MKKTFAILVLGLVLGAVNAGAHLYYDFDYINQTLGPTYTTKDGTFNIAEQGYNPTTESVSWAGFAFTFIDNDNREDTVRINLGNSVVNYEHIEYGFNIFGGLLTGNALLDLSSDGIISYRVRWISGDPFKLMTASLTAESVARAAASTPIPDGGTTLGLLGIALLALGWARTRLLKLPSAF